MNGKRWNGIVKEYCDTIIEFEGEYLNGKNKEKKEGKKENKNYLKNLKDNYLNIKKKIIHHLKIYYPLNLHHKSQRS